MGRKKRRPASLACFIQALEGTRVVVELRYDTIVRGTLTSADDYLNLLLADVTYQPLQGEKRQLEVLYVKARHVRFVHLPGNLDPAAAVDAHRRRAAQAVREHAQQQQAVKLQKGQQLELGSTSSRGLQTHDGGVVWKP
jgi:small nuclear ribonucleoprotein (snRNP)-like protein